MNYCVSDFVCPILSVQREWLDAHLEPGERILWATRPRPRVSITLGGCLGTLLPTAFMLGAGGLCCVKMPCQIWEWMQGLTVCDDRLRWVNGLLELLFMLAGFLFGLFILFLGLLIVYGGLTARRDLKRTLYVLTDRRALTLSPDIGRGCICDAYSLNEDMVRERGCDRAGDYLVFRLEEDGGKKGWYGLRDAEEAQERIAAAARQMGSGGQ